MLSSFVLSTLALPTTSNYGTIIGPAVIGIALAPSSSPASPRQDRIPSLSAIQTYSYDPPGPFGCTLVAIVAIGDVALEDRDKKRFEACLRALNIGQVENGGMEAVKWAQGGDRGREAPGADVETAFEPRLILSHFFKSDVQD